MDIKYHKNGKIDLNATIGTVANAIKIMHAGISTQLKREGFIIDMSIYGRSQNGICYGCAATCAIQQLAGKNFTVESINTELERAKYMKIDFDDYSTVESAFDNLRTGCLDIMRIVLDDESHFEEPTWNFEVNQTEKQIREELVKVKKYLEK